MNKSQDLNLGMSDFKAQVLSALSLGPHFTYIPSFFQPLRGPGKLLLKNSLFSASQTSV